MNRQPDDPGPLPRDDSDPRPVPPGWKVLAGIFGLAFATALILATTFWGEPDNSLHLNAQSWGFFLLLAILGGIGIGVSIDRALDWFRSR